ncbi:hypothetical protein GGTG_12727 [Gaeumannomyces tritici R3-111a-1]|uniref:Uncharacterized protein n=1 Tax=Gaeumannomyces tritici (strain R3-111a-1) TaxID=644352 RepID=J3PGU7_GAET3|nr:hypothetical protein GGTG_12727 [Gaeumannomyces tritici R3-111a-1]EJT69844.1 hypothetical protein GGTG_12727 [Gaeumannomyces tritici R3-111a-1]
MRDAWLCRSASAPLSASDSILLCRRGAETAEISNRQGRAARMQSQWRKGRTEYPGDLALQDATQAVILGMVIGAG